MSCAGVCSGSLSAAVRYGSKRQIRCICDAHHGGLSARWLVYCMGCTLHSVSGGWCSQPEAENRVSGKSEAADRTLCSLRLYHFFPEDPVGYRKLFSCDWYRTGAILFGPSIMSVLGIIVLLFQAILLAHGGLTTLGANTFSMAIFGPFVSYGLFQLLKKCKAPMGLAVFLSATIGDMATYCLTSVQLAAAYPGDNFWASFGKFIAVFAPTQVPIAIAEGILTVIVYNVIQKNCVKELKELSGITVSNPNRGKLWARNLVLALGVVLLVTVPLMLLGNSEFGGSDDAGSTVVEEINGGYTPWFESFWEPPSGEIESLLFCVQSAIGAGICGFVLGRISRKPKASASEDDAALTDQKQTSAS